MSMKNTDLKGSVAIMEEFAERTGLTSDAPPERYLWTDAFAVCNYLGLAESTGRRSYLDRALALIDQVHRTLGRHREDDPREGWISGLSEQEGSCHPTAGGLRIGKKLPERKPEQFYDPQREWERDGQYFHYLSRWMHALDRTARTTGEEVYARWSREMMETASNSFVYRDQRGGLGMFWKMSIDLSIPLVPSMGQHDPLDGCITSLQLAATAAAMSRDDHPLREERSRLAEWSTIYSIMVKNSRLETTDPLGLGGLMCACAILYQLILQEDSLDSELLAELLRASGNGMEHYRGSSALGRDPENRLAFRELGLSIGLLGASWVRMNVASGDGVRLARADLEKGLAGLGDHEPLGEDIVRFWMEPENQRSDSWNEHLNINSVMLATALAPEGYLVLPGVGTE